jgi:integrase
VAHETGMRLGEIARIEARDVDLARRVILLDSQKLKEGRRKIVPLHNSLMGILERRLGLESNVVSLRATASDRLPFVSGTGRRINAGVVDRTWRKACVRVLGEDGPLAGLRFHALRHTWRANAAAGLTDSASESILGHAAGRKSISQWYFLLSEDLLAAL